MESVEREMEALCLAEESEWEAESLACIWCKRPAGVCDAAPCAEHAWVLEYLRTHPMPERPSA